MTIKLRSGLVPLNLLTIVLVITVIFLPSDFLRILLGFPFLLLFPGFALTVALYPRKVVISNIERVALSFGLSVAIVILTGLILNYIPWGIRVESILISLSAIIFLSSVVAWFIQRRLTPDERFSIEFRLKAPGWDASIQGRTLSIILVITILGACFMVGYALLAPKTGQKFTEFYILSQERTAVYPRELRVGEQAKVIVGIVNNEYREMSYHVEIWSGQKLIEKLTTIMLEQGEKLEQEVVFALTEPGENKEIDFLLFQEGQDKPYHSLRIWCKVLSGIKPLIRLISRHKNSYTPHIPIDMSPILK